MRRLATGHYILLFYFTLEAATFAEDQHVCVDRTLHIQNALPNYFTAARGDIGPSVYHAATSVFQHVHKSGGVSVRVMLETVAKVYSERNVSSLVILKAHFYECIMATGSEYEKALCRWHHLSQSVPISDCCLLQVSARR